jgi:hypothetical protein
MHQSGDGAGMKKTYEKPVLVRRELLSKVTAFPAQSEQIIIIGEG